MTVSTPASLLAPAFGESDGAQGSECGHAYRLEATIGVEVLLTTAQLKGVGIGGIDLHVRDEVSTWMKSPAFASAFSIKLRRDRSQAYRAGACAVPEANPVGLTM
jgi:hypothetical protein